MDKRYVVELVKNDTWLKDIDVTEGKVHITMSIEEAKIYNAPGEPLHLVTVLGGRVLELGQEQSEKDQAYAERNQLVLFLSYLYPSYLARHEESDTAWEDDWRWIVVVAGPHGQMSWHIHDLEYVKFEHLPRLKAYKWDGHTREEKYQRLRACGITSKILRENGVYEKPNR